MGSRCGGSPTPVDVATGTRVPRIEVRPTAPTPAGRAPIEVVARGEVQVGGDLGPHSGAQVGSRYVSDFLRSYLTVGIFLGVGVVLVSALLGLASLLRPSKPSPQKHIVYESGVDPVGSGWSQSQIRYYIFALLFVMFDVEAVFIFPFATRVDAYGWFGVVEMAIFIVVLALGLLYAWKKKVLRWV
jgi:NADH:ubiquinone oxidoreductase subunit 3 (subunit A)